MPRADDDSTAAADRPDPPWPPRIGEPLPRAAEAYTEPRKLDWLLSDDGHGREWARVLHIGPGDTERFFDAIRKAVIDATIVRVTERHGITCGAAITLQIAQRSAKTTTSWHYGHAHDRPRLVTAYPRP
jgi:hypothetical protein